MIPYILEPDKSSKERRKNWSRLIQKIYEADPLICPKCSGEMKVISVIEDEEVIKKILRPWAVGSESQVSYQINLSACGHAQAGRAAEAS